MGRINYAIVKLFNPGLWWPELNQHLRRRITIRQKVAVVWGHLRRSLWPWLSMSARLVRVRRLRCRSGLRERFGRIRNLIHDAGSIGASFGIGFSLLSLLLLFSCTWGFLFDRTEVEERINNLIGALMTLAEIVGGITALLYAVILFALQFHADKLGETSFLVRYLGRREGVTPIATILLSITAANVISAIIACLGLPYAAEGMARANIVAIPLAFVLVLWLIYRMVESAAGDFIRGSVVPGLACENGRDTEEKAHLSAMTVKFEQVLRRQGAAYHAGASLWLRNEPLVFRLRKGGQICDVNIELLRQLILMVRHEFTEGNIEFLIAPGQEAKRNDPAICIRVESSHQRPSELPLIRRELQTRVEKLLGQCFLTRGRSSRPVEAIVRRLGEAILNQATHASATEFDRSLDLKDLLVEMELRYVASIESIESGLSGRLMVFPDEPFSGDVAYYKVAEATTESGDRQKVKDYLWFCTRLMKSGLEYRNLTVFATSGRVLQAVYLYARRNPGLRDWIGSEIDSRIHSVLFEFECRRLDGGGHAAISQELPFLRAALFWVLSLIKTALESDAAQDASDFHDRLFEFDRHYHYRRVSRYERGRLDQGVIESLNLHLYAEIVIAGWCLFLARAVETRNELLGPLFRETLKSFATRHELIRVWEDSRRSGPLVSETDSVLGVEHWERPGRRIRVGVITTWRTSFTWLQAGFTGLGLMLPDEERKGGYFDGPPPFQYDPPRIRRVAEELMHDEFVCQELLGLWRRVFIPMLGERQDEKPIDAFLSVIRGRERSRSIAELERLEAAPISNDRLREVQIQVGSEFEQARRILHMLQHFEVPESDQASMPTSPISFKVPKDLLIEDTTCIFGFESRAATLLANLEAERILRPLLENAAVATTVDRVANSPTAIDSALADLRNRGYQPNAIIIPYKIAWANALSPDDDSWRYQDPERYGDAHLTNYRDLPVYGFCPHNETKILIVDVRACFRLLPKSDEPVKLTGDDRYREQNQQLLERAKTWDGIPDIDATQFGFHLECELADSAIAADSNAALIVRISDDAAVDEE